MIEMNEHEIIETSKLYFKFKIITHVDTKDGGFYNGLLVEVGKEGVVICDRKDGNFPILFSNIKLINKFKSAKK